MIGLSGSESTVVEAPEKSVESVRSVSACLRLGGEEDCKESTGSRTCVRKDSVDVWG